MTSTSLPVWVGVDDHVAHAPGHAQDLADGHAPAIGAGHQALGDHALDRSRDHAARLLVLVGREEVEHAVDRLGRIDRVDRRQHEVAGLGSGQRRLHGLLVAHLADEDHVRVLAQDPSQGALEGRRVHADLALVDHRALVFVDELDRVLDRDDVLARRVVHVVDHRGERGRLSRAGRSREQHDAALLFGQFLDHRRQRQLVDRADLVRHRATCQRDHAALLEGVDAVARDALDFKGEVDLVLLGELLEPRLVA